MSLMFQINAMLDKMSNLDRDLRYMATSDLLAELQKDTFQLDREGEKRVMDALLARFADQAGDIQTLAIKCLTVLAGKASDLEVERAADKLCAAVLTGSEEHRDISTQALKVLVAQARGDGAPTTMATRLAPRLVQGISTHEEKQVKRFCLDVLLDVVERYGGHMVALHEPCKAMLLPLLDEKHSTIRKRAIQILGPLGQYLSTPLFTALVDELVARLRAAQRDDTRRALALAIGAISRRVGFRIGPHLATLVPLLSAPLTMEEEMDAELAESCLRVFASTIVRCPADIAPFLAQLETTCLAGIKFDPNYADDSDDEDGDDDDAMGDGDDHDDDDDDEDDYGDDDFGDEYDEGDYTDDDDVSWKVRRASVKCLAALISARPEKLTALWRSVAPPLIRRFREREEQVKLDMFAAVETLLEQTARVAGAHDDDAMRDDENDPVALARSQVPLIVRHTTKLLRDRTAKTVQSRLGALHVLAKLVGVVPCALDGGHLARVVPGVLQCVQESSTGNNDSTLTIEALTLLRHVLRSHASAAVKPFLAQLVPPLLECVGAQYYRITSVALSVCVEVAKALAPPVATGGDAVMAAADDEAHALVPSIYASVLARLQAQDQDQEVKEQAIHAMAVVVSQLHALLDASKLSTCLPLLCERMENEITRMTAVKAMEHIASSASRVPLDAETLHTAVSLTASFLRKQNRQLRHHSLLALEALIRGYGAGVDEAQLQEVLAQLAPLIDESDLHSSHRAIEVVVSALNTNKDVSDVVANALLPAVVQLVQSPLLQGHALESLLRLFATLSNKNLPNLSFDVLMGGLLGIPEEASAPLKKQAYVSISQCIGTLCVYTAHSQRYETVAHFVDALSKANDPSAILMALYGVGRIGRSNDLSAHSALNEHITKHFGAVFEGDDARYTEDVKAAASFTLGNVALGNLGVYLPFVLRSIHANDGKTVYLYLQALKEIIVAEHTDAHLETLKDTENLNQVVSMLMEHTTNEEEGVRNVVAECLGRLALVEPTKLFDLFDSQLRSGDALSRATIITALKYAVDVRASLAADSNGVRRAPDALLSRADGGASSGAAAAAPSSSAADGPLQAAVGMFAELIATSNANSAAAESANDWTSILAELQVRKQALVTLNNIAHNKAGLVWPVLSSELLHAVYGEACYKEQLLRVVKIGPLTHRVDQGLDVRKAAYECMDTLMSKCLHHLDVATFIGKLVDGLGDVSGDIKLLVHLIVCKLVLLAPAALLAHIDAMVDPLARTVKAVVSEGGVKEAAEKAQDLIVSGIRVVVALQNVPDVTTSAKFNALVKDAQSGDLAAKYDAVAREGTGATAGGAAWSSSSNDMDTSM